MRKYIVRVTDGSSFGDFTVTNDSLIDACGHAVDQVAIHGEPLTKTFESDWSAGRLFVDSVYLADNDDEWLDVPRQFMSEADRLEAEVTELRAEVARLKAKCGESSDA